MGPQSTPRTSLGLPELTSRRRCPLSAAILRISALSHNYRGIDGINADLALPDGAPQPGDRAPDCVLQEAAPRHRLYDVTRHPRHTLLLLSDGSEWGMFRRDPSNNGIGQGGTPFLEPRFLVKMLPPDNEFMTQDEKAGFEVL